LVWLKSVSFSQENHKIRILPPFSLVVEEKRRKNLPFPPLFVVLLLVGLAFLTVHCLRRESFAHMGELGSGKDSVERGEIDGLVW
jgi:hypothetical protein